MCGISATTMIHRWEGKRSKVYVVCYPRPANAENFIEVCHLKSPHKTTNQIIAAPKPVTRHIIVCSRPVVPAVVDSEEVTDNHCQNPPRFSYPDELLKHEFVPYGAHSSGSTNQMDVDAVKPKLNSREAKDKEKKSKKRKGDADSSKKPKKIRTSSP
jgi:hypothetical protein